MNVSPISSRILMYYAWQFKPEQFSIPSFWNMIPTYGIYSLAGWPVLGFPCGAAGWGEVRGRAAKGEGWKGRKWDECWWRRGWIFSPAGYLSLVLSLSWRCRSALQPTTETVYSVRELSTVDTYHPHLHTDFWIESLNEMWNYIFF